MRDNPRFDTTHAFILSLRPSRYFVRGLFLLILSSVLLLSLLPLPFWVKLALSGSVLFWGGHTLAYYGYYWRHPLRRFYLLEQQCRLANGVFFELEPQSFTQPKFIYLCCRLAQRRVKLFIFADALPPDLEFWQLRRRVERLLVVHKNAIPPKST